MDHLSFHTFPSHCDGESKAKSKPRISALSYPNLGSNMILHSWVILTLRSPKRSGIT